jgi:hypothetical protein
MFVNYDADTYINTDNINSDLTDTFISKFALNEKKNKKTKFNDFAKLEYCVSQIESQQINLTDSESDWTLLSWSFAELGDEGREYFHRISKLYRNYDYNETENKFDSCLARYNDERTGVNKFFKLCNDNGIKYGEPIFANKEDSGIIFKSANQWMDESKGLPRAKQLFGQLWYEGEICIFFASSNIGKSILAVQIADGISKGIPLFGLLKCEVEFNQVLYLDFEMSIRQFSKRSSDENGNMYNFSGKFFRAEINNDSAFDGNTKFENWVIGEVEKVILETGINIVIIDNVSFLNPETEKASNVLKLMTKLKTLKKKHNLSLLVLAHTPKRDNSKMITKNDLFGSSVLMNACDSAFAIGESRQNKDYRYIKQIKARDNEKSFDYDNVIICKIQKPDNFLHFKFIDFDYESEHLYTENFMKKSERDSTVLKLRNEGFSYNKIVEETGVAKSTVADIIKKQIKNPNTNDLLRTESKIEIIDLEND